MVYEVHGDELHVLVVGKRNADEVYKLLKRLKSQCLQWAHRGGSGGIAIILIENEPIGLARMTSFVQHDARIGMLICS